MYSKFGYTKSNKMTSKPKFKKGQKVVCFYDEDKKPLIIKSMIFNGFDWIYNFQKSPLVIIEQYLNIL